MCPHWYGPGCGPFSQQPNPPALVLAGGKGWDEEIEPALAGVPSHMRVLRPGYLPLEDLPRFPLRLPGFGLPQCWVKALACRY